MAIDPVFSNPQGEEGIAVLERMNEHHRPLSEWALDQLPDMSPADILDIGCGGGMLISLLAEKYKPASLKGIDISDQSVAFARKVNSRLIEDGRCDIIKASVSDIPFKDGSFDLVISCESYFFWPNLENDLKEACRVVKYGGYIVIVSEAYPHPMFDRINEEHSRKYGMFLRPNDYMSSLISSFGFEVTTVTVEEKNWVIFFAKRIPFSSD